MGVCLSLKSIKFNVKEESSIMKADETKRKREILLGINPCIYGLNYHDPAVVVLIDGRVVFGVEEERCNRVKHSKGVFPSLALAECLTYCNLTWDDIDAVVIGYEPALWMNRLNLELLDIINPFVSCVSNSIQIRGSEIVEKIIRTNIVDRYTFFRSQENVRKLIIEKCSALETTKVMFCEHHLAHIASSYEVSGFSEAVGIVVDGIGETAVTTLWRIQNHQYEKILQIDYPNSLGYFYAIATKFLGFEPWGGEGKTMALAAYGKKNKEIADRLKSAFTLNGAFYDVSHFMHNHNAGFLMMNEDELIHELEALLGFSAREKDASITDEHIDFAWFVQDYLERSVIRLINYAVQKTGIVNVCAAGGVFMNCKMNMVIRETSEATNFYVQPLSSDIGLTVGAGLYHTWRKPKRTQA
jgi:carbamoyltransferase